MFSLGSTRTSRSFSAKLLSRWVASILVNEVVPPQVQDFALHEDEDEVHDGIKLQRQKQSKSTNIDKFSQKLRSH